MGSIKSKDLEEENSEDSIVPVIKNQPPRREGRISDISKSTIPATPPSKGGKLI